MGLGGVLDHREPSSLGESVDRAHVSGETVEVDRHDRTAPRRHPSGGIGRVDVIGHGVDVGEDRDRPLMEHGLGRGDERQRGDDHLIARAHARRCEGDVERRGPAVGREAEPRADRRRKLGLERPHLGRACAGQHAAIEHAGHGGAVVVGQDRPAARRHRARGCFLRIAGPFFSWRSLFVWRST